VMHHNFKRINTLSVDYMHTAYMRVALKTKCSYCSSVQSILFAISEHGINMQ